jgi:hypothetical protein
VVTLGWDQEDGMDRGLIVLGIAMLPGFAFFTFIYAVAVKLIERRLTFKQALLISALAILVPTAILIAFTFAKLFFAIGTSFDSVVNIFDYLVVGAIVTRLARNYGIEKYGWLGLGGRANICLLVLSLFLVAVYSLVVYIKGG